MSKSVALSATALENVLAAEQAVMAMIEPGGTFGVEDFVQAFNSLHVSDVTARDEAAAARIQWAVEFIDRIMADDDLLAKYLVIRDKRGVKPPQKNGNDYSHFIRVLFGKFVTLPAKGNDGEKTVWLPNTSALKYAQAIREIKRLGWDTAEIKKMILDHRNVDGTAGITGLVEDDTRANSKDPDPGSERNLEFKWKGETKKEALNAEGLCELVIPPEVQNTLIWHEGFCNVTLVRKNGKVRILCDLLTDGRKVVKAVHDRKDTWIKTAA